ncbi:MAG: alpha/beta fold hydrolase [Pirellulaceae bacterium]|jgi:pimeloyl-ACP methyl ester carboxylesterase|nr:alpha/beta fold hydrolase [Pirellulaceae bacterium]MDP7015658.1 alpha/beta fold hydrolase [Pirellulaceae bacterium]
MTTADEQVVLVHGFGAKRIWMSRMSRRLESDGYHCHSWSYFSLLGALDDHAERLCDYLVSRPHANRDLHVVAHSMGAIIARVALLELARRSESRRIGRVVLLAPPNHGARLASVVGPVVRPICPAIHQLSISQESFVNRLEPPTDQVGVLAARYDWLVPHSSARLGPHGPYHLLTGTHNSLLFQESSLRRVSRFLRSGSFDGRGLDAAN